MSEIDSFALAPPEAIKRGTRPAGYAGQPGRGPAGKCCKDCAHYRYQKGVAGSYPKCGLMHACWTSGRKTDILARSPACQLFENNVKTYSRGE